MKVLVLISLIVGASVTYANERIDRPLSHDNYEHAEAAKTSKDLVGSWELVGLYCEDGSSLTNEGESEAQRMVGNGTTRNFDKDAIASVYIKFASAFTSGDICSSETTMSYTVSMSDNKTLLSVGSPQISIPDCWATSLVLGFFRNIQNESEDVSYEIKITGDRLKLFRPLMSAETALSCGEKTRVIEEYKRI